MNSDNLNCSQLRALYRYISDGYVIINSGRRSGKSTTLMAIVDYWIEHQAKDEDVCVIIGNAHIQFYKHFYENMIKRQYKYMCNCVSRSTYFEFVKWNGDKYYIEFYKTKEEYFNRKYNHHYAGINVTLLVGDECYIGPDRCEHTACAYTQYPNTTSLSYDGLISKEEIERIRKNMNKEAFDREFGQYL